MDKEDYIKDIENDLRATYLGPNNEILLHYERVNPEIRLTIPL